MAKGLQRTLAQGIAVIAPVAGVFAATTGVASAATTKPPTTAAPSTSPNSSCYSRIVYLHGNNPATTTCVLTQKPATGMASPNTVKRDCVGGLPQPGRFTTDANGEGSSCSFSHGPNSSWIPIGFRIGAAAVGMITPHGLLSPVQTLSGEV